MPFENICKVYMYLFRRNVRIKDSLYLDGQVACLNKCAGQKTILGNW